MSPIQVITRPRTIEYGSESIPYETRFADRETLEISVHPDRSVEVVAPLGSSPDVIEARVRRKVRWIVRQRVFFDAVGPPNPPRTYRSGETIRYLGRQYRLRVQQAETGWGAKLAGPYLTVTAGSADPSVVRPLVDAWYRRRADAKLPKRYALGTEQVRRYGIVAPPMSIRRMRTRWGSYTASGRVLLNPELMIVPVFCIDYVVIHELCHAKHPNHGAAFYDLLDLVLPDWRRAKARLDRSGR